MTPNETLKRIVNEINIYKLHGIGEENWLGVQDVIKDIGTLEQALNELESLNKSPTAEELCQALSECLAKDVSYSGVTKQFYYTIENTKCIIAFITETYGDGLWSINGYLHLPPHLITLIGRFYEGLEKAGKEE